jgi:FKBP-type peptidyl-prolyl cis-trans isomerase FklB
VIAEWIEALQLMKVGGKFRLFIPYKPAYGSRGAGNQIGPDAALIFDVDLLDIQKQSFKPLNRA